MGCGAAGGDAGISAGLSHFKVWSGQKKASAPPGRSRHRKKELLGSRSLSRALRGGVVRDGNRTNGGAGSSGRGDARCTVGERLTDQSRATDRAYQKTHQVKPKSTRT